MNLKIQTKLVNNFAKCTYARHFFLAFRQPARSSSLSSADIRGSKVLARLLREAISAMLPSFPPYRYLYFLVPRLYSLVDDIKVWYKKAIRLITFSEVLRFLVGLLPLPFTKYGITTSPFTYFAYTFLYVYPTDSYERIVQNNEVGFIDVLVFIFIYLVYFAIYEFFLLKKIKKYMVNQQEYLEGARNEREKYYNYNKIKLYD